MIRLWLTCLIAMTALAWTQPAKAWGEFGHRSSGAIALANVSEETRAKIERLLDSEAALGTPDCPLETLEDATVWPDCIRRDGLRWGFTAAWHYRTTPICEAFDPRANCPGGACVTGQITRNLHILADERLPDPVRLEALAFLVHFVGDVHMPLHSGDKDDRGGNDRDAAYGIVPGMNLHWIWDGALAERAITDTPLPLVRRYTQDEREQMNFGSPDDWARESWQLSRDFVYPNAFDEEPCEGADLPTEAALTQEDIEAAIPVAQQRVAQAGLRMARLLEEAFVPGPLPRPEWAR
ncbi:S1/P1 nuclease [Parapontixanthobacter aurantiacus]|nr:S1/P1 nuclease [Parapontixanthobacter aurantiacus]